MKKKATFYEATIIIAALLFMIGTFFGASNAEYIGKNKENLVRVAE